MFAIGDFARHGRVSVRMLRHYDAIGLLRPAHVDPFTGYRHYTAAQLARLNRIIALKDLGFTLQQVHNIVDGTLSADELRGMLRLRRAELESAVAESHARLIGVEARLRAIEREGHMPSNDVVVKRIPAVRVAELTAIAESYEPGDIGPVISPLYDELLRRLEAAGVTPVAGGEIKGDLAVRDLAPITEAATIVHRGSMDAVVPTGQALAEWIDANGYRAVGYAREVSLECPENRDEWVTELQVAITRA
jgi:DNA-binding transcriptional MerR regulator